MDIELAQKYDELMNDEKFFSKYNKLKKELEKAMEQWEMIQEEIDVKS